MSFTRLGARIARRHPFTARYASNLPILFGVVYFAQGMWHLPRQSVVIALKDGGLSAVQVAMFFSAGASALAWVLVPLVRIDAIEARVRQEADAAEVRHAPTLPRDGGMSTTGLQFYPWEVEQCDRYKAR